MCHHFFVHKHCALPITQEILFTQKEKDRKWHCVVPENIQTPTTEGIGNSRGVGGSEAQEIPEGRGLDHKITFQGVNIILFPTCPSYRPGRSFLGHK